MTYYVARFDDDHTIIGFAPFDDRPYITVEELPEGDGPLMCTADGILYRGIIPIPPEEPSNPIEDLDAMVVDHEYRLALLELGLNENESEV